MDNQPSSNAVVKLDTERCRKHPAQGESRSVSFETLGEVVDFPQWRQKLPKRIKLNLSTLLFTAAVIAALIYGWQQRNEYWIDAAYGTGYWLGIIGSSMMAVLLLYPVRKKWKPFRSFFNVKAWFQWHMVLGIVGPVLILYHSNFKLGATNSNVALFSMILVVISGLFGRYIYRQFHDGLYGNELNYKSLRKHFEKEKKKILGSSYLSAELKAHLTALDKLANSRDQSVVNQWRINRKVKKASEHVMRQIKKETKRAKKNKADKTQLRQLNYLRDHLRLEVGYLKKMTKFALYSHLFSIWHVLHFPLFVLLIIAAIFHIIAVHLY